MTRGRFRRPFRTMEFRALIDQVRRWMIQGPITGKVVSIRMKDKKGKEILLEMTEPE